MSLDYDGEYDGLLFFFHKQYELIQNYYKDHPQKKFISKKLDSDTYIRYDQQTFESFNRVIPLLKTFFGISPQISDPSAGGISP